MSGIPVYTSSPINAVKAAAATPQTSAASQEKATTAPNSAPATTTSTATSTSSYPPARPGAAAFPGPTPAVTPRYAPLQPTPTSQYSSEGPPAPQPGAIPIPSRATILPPPKAGESCHLPQQTASSTSTTNTGVTQPYPAQMSIPPPTTHGAQPPRSSTSTTGAASMSYPVGIPASEFEAPRRSFEHPPGYQQNVYASELTNDQRRTREAGNSSALASQNSSDLSSLDSQGAWGYVDTATKWAQQAVQQTGQKLSAAEQEIWNRINKQ